MNPLKSAHSALKGYAGLKKSLKERGVPNDDIHKIMDAYFVLEKVNSYEPKLRQETDQELMQHTSDFRERIAKGASLDDMLPEAFAVAKEAARRVYGNKGEEVEGSARQDPERCKEIFGKGESPKFGMHYDEQVVGGIMLHRGYVAEMYTGEGKTLVAALPAYLNALEEKGVHIATSNEYLAGRDAEWMSPLFNLLGLSVGAVNEGDSTKLPGVVYSENGKGAERVLKEMAAEISHEYSVPLWLAETELLKALEEKEPAEGAKKSKQKLRTDSFWKEFISKTGMQDSMLPGESAGSVISRLKRTALNRTRKEAYLCDITYGTSEGFGFDYLRDNMADSPEKKVQRGHNYAIIDEVDDQLIDKAGTPLIISRTEPHPDEKKLELADRIAECLVEEQKKLVKVKRQQYSARLEELGAKDRITRKERKEKSQLEKEMALLEAEIPGTEFGGEVSCRMWDENPNFYSINWKNYNAWVDDAGFEWMEKSFDFGKYDADDVELIEFVNAALKARTLYSDKKDYIIGLMPSLEDKMKSAEVVLANWAVGAGNRAGNMKILYNFLGHSEDSEMDLLAGALFEVVSEMNPDDAAKTGEIAGNPNESRKWLCSTLDAMKSYVEHGKREEWVKGILGSFSARVHKNEDRAIIVDDNTGMPMYDMRWGEGMHEAVEQKEGLQIRGKSERRAVTTLPFYFAKYSKRAGMTGTAKTDEDEFRTTYGMDVVVVPTHKPNMRADREDTVYRTEYEKFNAVVDEILAWNSIGRPVLVGTSSVKNSEKLANMLLEKGLSESQFEVLNAEKENLEKEAEIVAKAGQRYAITIATDMAGRGTDISLGEGVEKIGEGYVYDNMLGKLVAVKEGKDKGEGGLVVIGTERHESKRVDNQLRGRAGRQGDPGTAKFYASLEDGIFKFLREKKALKKSMESLFKPGEGLSHKILTWAADFCQDVASKDALSRRKTLFNYDSVLDSQREAFYSFRNSALEGKGSRKRMFSSLDRIVKDVAAMSEEKANEIMGFVRKRRKEKKSGKAAASAWVQPAGVLGSNASGEPEFSAEFMNWYEESRTRAAGEETRFFPDSVYEDDVRNFLIEKKLEDLFNMDGLHVPRKLSIGNERITGKALKSLETQIKAKYQSTAGECGASFQGIEQRTLLSALDRIWKEHLAELGWLKNSMWMRAYGEMTPEFEYLSDSSELLNRLMAEAVCSTMGNMMAVPHLMRIAAEKQVPAGA